MSASNPSRKTDTPVRKAEGIRDREHRLSSGLRLKTLADVVEFVHSKGLVSLLGGNELPSMISAVLGRPWKPSAKGFTGWLDWWSLKFEGQQLARVLGDIERRNDILASRIFRRSKTFISDRLWPILDPIVEHHKNLATRGRMLPPLELKILKTIDREVSIRTDLLRKGLKLEDEENNYRFHRSLANLESYGLIVGAEDPSPERHIHANIWQTWEKRTHHTKNDTRTSYEKMVAKLLERTIEACVLVREDRIKDWYRWSTDTEHAKEDLLKEGAIARVGGFLIPSRIFSHL